MGGSSFTAGSMPLPSASDGIRGVLGPAGTYGGYGSTCIAPQAAAGGSLSDTGAWHSNGKQAGGGGNSSSTSTAPAGHLRRWASGRDRWNWTAWAPSLCEFSDLATPDLTGRATMQGGGDGGGGGTINLPGERVPPLLLLQQTVDLSSRPCCSLSLQCALWPAAPRAPTAPATRHRPSVDRRCPCRKLEEVPFPQACCHAAPARRHHRCSGASVHRSLDAMPGERPAACQAQPVRRLAQPPRCS